MNKKDLIPLIIACIGLFLAPIIGGHIRSDQVIGMSGSTFGGIYEGNWPMGSLAILATALILPLIISIFSRKVQHVPSWHLWAPLSAFFLLFCSSSLWSDFPQSSQDMMIQWCIYGATFFAIVAVVGRKQGIQAAISCIIAGSTFTAIRGILEYSSMKAIDPTWRIFGGWINPNALAALLIISIILSLGMLGNEDRLVKLVVGASVVLQGLAFLLTQSKGGFLGLFVGLVFFVIMIAVRKQGKLVLAVFGLLSLVALLGFGVQSSSKNPGGSGALSRVSQSSTTSEQSEGFRNLLWQGAIANIKADPIGTGIGTYRFESSRSGFHTQTALTHQTFLQVAFEGGVVSLLFLLTFVVMWCFITLRGFRNLPVERAITYAGIFAALAASAAHSLVDSDWYYPGIGLLVFTLMGLGVQCAQDSSSPEFTRRHNLNILGLTACIALLIAAWIPAYRDSQVLKANNFALNRETENYKKAWKDINQAFPKESASYRVLAEFASADKQKILMNSAISIHPSTSNYRFLANIELGNKDYSEAEKTLYLALKRDPKNLPTLKILLETQLKQDNIDAAKRTMERIRGVETSSYFLSRALPEVIPTESYEARILLSKAIADEEEFKLLNLEAAEGLKKYLQITAIKALEYRDTPSGFGGETLDEAIEKAKLALEAGQIIQKEFTGKPNQKIGDQVVSLAKDFLAKASLPAK